jgi:hypothetical protein
VTLHGTVDRQANRSARQAEQSASAILGDLERDAESESIDIESLSGRQIVGRQDRNRSFHPYRLHLGRDLSQVSAVVDPTSNVADLDPMTEILPPVGRWDQLVHVQVNH